MSLCLVGIKFLKSQSIIELNEFKFKIKKSKNYKKEEFDEFETDYINMINSVKPRMLYKTKDN